ncbi:hypothetical protein DITRI_Ditri01bG0027500 [Diplodiscus trichospermus]
MNPIACNSHARSISLPSRSHPTIPQIQEHLFRLRPIDVTCLSLSTINCKLSGLGDLFDCFDKFLLLSQTQQALSRGCNEKWADELLDGLLLLLDVCGIAQDVLSQTKQHMQELQSMLRRRRADECQLAKEVAEYLATRKMAKKMVHKVLKALKNKFPITCSLADKGNDSMAMNQSLGCTLVSNLMRSKHGACIEEAMASNEFEKVDAVLQILFGQKTKKSSNLRAENVQTDLGKLELSVEDVEQELECLHRGLIKTRVSLLNILNH